MGWSFGSTQDLLCLCMCVSVSEDGPRLRRVGLIIEAETPS